MTLVTQHNKKVTGLILTYNCEKMLEEIFRRIPKSAVDDIFIADDSSSDNTGAVAQKLNINFFSHNHTGYGGNLLFGLNKAMERGADYIVEIHGDGQYDPAVIPEAIKKMEEGYDFVMGSRFFHWRDPLRDNMSIVRYLANIGLSSIARFIFRLSLTEFHSGFRVYSRKMIETLELRKNSSGHLFSFEIIAQAHYCKLQIAEIPIRCDYHKVHTSISLTKASIFAFEMFEVFAEFILARLGFKTRLFRCRQNKK